MVWNKGKPFKASCFATDLENYTGASVLLATETEITPQVIMRQKASLWCYGDLEEDQEHTLYSYDVRASN